MIGIVIGSIGSECSVCEKRLIEWLEKHRDEINRALMEDITSDRADDYEHTISSIGEAKITLEIEKKEEMTVG